MLPNTALFVETPVVAGRSGCPGRAKTARVPRSTRSADRRLGACEWGQPYLWEVLRLLEGLRAVFRAGSGVGWLFDVGEPFECFEQAVEV